MPEHFDEEVFVACLAARQEEAIKYLSTFDPLWLNDASLCPVVKKIFEFTRQYGVPPSLSTLHQVFKDEDEAKYDANTKEVLNRIQLRDVDQSLQLHTLAKVRDMTIVRSFESIVTNPDTLTDVQDFNGKSILRAVSSWVTQFSGVTDEESFDMQEAIEALLKGHTLTPYLNERIPCGIHCLDDFMGGGGKLQQLCLIVAPTGHGKSVCLMNIAYATAMTHPTWFITNELTMKEQTERFFSRMTGTRVNLIQDNPYEAYDQSKLKHYWDRNLQDNLRITSINREVSTADLEAEMIRWSNISGFKPRVIALDYMKRMKPIETGWNRSETWNWQGAIALDLTRFAKRHDILIWTAAQTNREGLDSEYLNLSMTSGSTQHLEEATYVFGMRQKDLGDGERGMTFQSLKTRHSKSSPEMKTMRIDLARMRITDEEVDLEDLEEPAEDAPDVPKMDKAKAKRDDRVSKQKAAERKKKYGS